MRHRGGTDRFSVVIQLFCGSVTFLLGVGELDLEAFDVVACFGEGFGEPLFGPGQCLVGVQNPTLDEGQFRRSNLAIAEWIVCCSVSSSLRRLSAASIVASAVSSVVS